MPSLLLPPRFSIQEMSDKKSPPRKEKAFIVRTPQPDDKGMKRKLLSPGSPTHDDDDKRTPNKRKRGSVSLEVSPIPGHLTTPKTPSGGSRSAPLSERQQLAMIMRMEDESVQDSPVKPPSPLPLQSLKRTSIDKKVHKRNERGELPIHLAAIKGDVKLLKKLIKDGADVNVADFAGWTPLHEASNRGWLYVAKQLLKAGANVNVQGLENDTPLHDASINGHRKLVELLLKHGANPLQQNSKGRTPLDVAPCPEMVKLLKKETIYSGSDTSSIDDIRSPMSPDSIISIKDEDRSLDADELHHNRSESFSSQSSNNRRLSMPKSPDGKLASPRLCLKFQRDHYSQINQKSKDSKEPQYKSYSVTNVSIESSVDNPMFSPVDSPASSVDSDLYNPGFDSLTNFSGSKLKISLPEEETVQLPLSFKQNLMLSSMKIDHGQCNSMEVYPDQGIFNNNKNNNKSSNHISSGGNADVNKPVLKSVETRPFSPRFDWSDSQREDSMELPDLNVESSSQTIPIPTPDSGTICLNDTREFNCVLSTSSESYVTHNHSGGQPQSTVTSTTGSNNIILSTHVVNRDWDKNVSNSNFNGNSECVKNVTSDTNCSVSSVNTSTNCVSSIATTNVVESSHVTSLKWELRSSSSPKSDDGSCVHINKTENIIRPCSPSSKADKEAKWSENRESRPSSPKVPPLKIIIPTKSQASSTSDSNDTRLKLVVTNVKSALPYVINPYQDQGREAESVTVVGDSNMIVTPTLTASSIPNANNVSIGPTPNGDNTSDMCKVKSEEGSESDRNVDVELDSTLVDDTNMCSAQPEDKLNDRDNGNKSDSDASKKDDKKDEPTQRVLRSAVRSQQQSETKTSKPVRLQDKSDRNSNTDSSSSSVTEAASVVVAASTTAPFVNKTIKDEDDANIPPRKRKLPVKPKLDNNLPPSDSPVPVSTPVVAVDKVPNSYDLFLSLRKKIASRRQSMMNICPKTPLGFKDYLMKTCNYVLQGNATSTLSVPTLSPPNSVTDKMRDLFVLQEEARYKLRLQHLIEREKLMLSIEQEILREHGRSARALVNQGTPLSVCTILKDEEIYNMNNTDQEEKDKKNRTRYNGRQFLSWIQDVDDKYEKIKELLILRQKQEADSLYAIQKLEWEWRLKDLGQCDRNLTPEIDELHIPLVQVQDNFDLLPT